MNIVVWTDKGGVGKTTLAANLSAHLGLPLVDLDPQGDATRWAALRGQETLVPKDRKALETLLRGKGGRVVDCPPGQSPEALTAVALADLLVVPTRSGEADLVALGRTLDVARRVRKARPDLQVGLVLSLARETGRAKGVEAALRAQSGAEYAYLGRLSARVGVEEAAVSGKTLLQMGGAVAHEARQILEAVASIVSAN